MTMYANRVVTTGVAALLAVGSIEAGADVHDFQAARPDPVVAQAGEAQRQLQPAITGTHDGLLSVTGVVRLRGGSPAAGATVRSNTGSDEPSTITHTDAAGRFQLRAMFGNGGRLHLTSADGSLQAVLKVSSLATRTVFAVPLELTLLPALNHQVTVLAEGRPVPGAHVAALGADFQVEGVTGQDGKARLKLPAKDRLSELVAWHPTLGVSGKRDLADRPREGATELSLLPPAPHRVRVVDLDGKGVSGLELAISVHPENSDWIVAKHIAAAHVPTGADGTAIVPWVPREKLRFVEVDPLGSDWKVDETDQKQISAGITTVHARRERSVQGRLIMPAGKSAEGILVTGFGFGPANNGDIPHARARRDGTFTLRVPSEHAYVLGIVDLEWASDPWSGMILSADATKAAEITMNVYPATQLVVRVTRGPKRDPVANAWIDLSSRGHVSWTDSKGKKKTGQSGARAWLTTDSGGVARAAVGKGTHELRLSSGDWNEEQTIQVNLEKPVEVAFHRSWIGRQRITGRLMVDGAPYPASPSLVARAWTPQQGIGPLTFEPVVHPDGTFEVPFDAETVSLFFLDRDRHRSGIALDVHGDARADVAMEKTATTYSGTVLDENNHPMANRTLQIYVKTSRYHAVAPAKTDKNGRFRFAGVPCNVPLELNIQNEPQDPQYFLFDRDRIFNPGEVRENEQLKPRRSGA